MPKNRGGLLTEGGSVIFAFRVPNEVAAQVDTACGGKDFRAEWLRNLLRTAVAGKIGLGASQAIGFQEGKAQGWAHANRIFREALTTAAAKLRA